MTAPATATCTPWATEADVVSPCVDYDQTLLAEALQIASDVLYEFTGRRWPGLCTATVRPCGYRTAESCGCLSSATCGCRRLSEIDLPGPIASIGEIKIDGVVVDPARYRVDDWRHLVYLPESDSAERQGWPCCQRLDLADTEADTWSITYTYGQDPPAGGARSAALLGCQLALAFQPETVDACKLPKRITNITRQGISMAVLDPLTLFDDGKTGLETVDLWVASVRLGARRRRGKVLVPGQGAHGIRRAGT